MFSQKNILGKMRAIKIHITFFLTILASAPLLAQLTPFAIINDSDGYTNIRYGKNKKIVDRLHSNQVFAIRSIVDDDGWQDWFWIDYPDYAQRKKPFERFVNKTRDGMIHKSRMKALPDLPQWKKSLEDSTLVCTRGLDRITIRYGKFIKKNHTYQKVGQDLIVKIDGSEPWGIDGVLHDNTTEIKSITIEINKQKSEFPQEAIKNMLRPTTILANFGVAESSDKTLFLYMSNSDAAGGYDVVWTIKSGRVVNQFIYRNF